LITNMDEVIEQQILDFVCKHRMGLADKVMQAMCVVEEANELVTAAMSRGNFPFSDLGYCHEREEVADVIITALVYAGISGFLDEVDHLVREKMKINLEKPVRQQIGVKVGKR